MQAEYNNGTSDNYGWDYCRLNYTRQLAPLYTFCKASWSGSYQSQGLAINFTNNYKYNTVSVPTTLEVKWKGPAGSNSKYNTNCFISAVYSNT